MPRPRLATPEDAPRLAALVRGLEVFRAEEAPAATEARLRALLELPCGASLWVAEDDAGAMLGYALVFWHPQLFAARPTAYLAELFVAPEARGRGAGHALVGAAVRAAKARGCRRMQLIAMRERASYRRGFYPKLGFVERPEAADFVLPLQQVSPGQRDTPAAQPRSGRRS